ncbi:MAG: MBL fold metallo-hydrolase [Alphaproteobacteria bacterium]|nr:MAG: MBL fold metallo-hydrolase [Alphaproteobacteria bacterium]
MKSNNLNSMTALGTGTSTGIPMIGCGCSVCTSLDHRDQRMRSSIFIETSNGKKILIDTTPDLRTQFLTNKISDIDFVIMTHEHADHLHGIDDLRPLTFGPPTKEIPIYCNQQTKEVIEKRFEYIFQIRDLQKTPILGGGIPRLKLNAVDLQKNVHIQNEEFYFFNYPHGHGTTMGFVHDGLAYIVDCMELPDEIVSVLKHKKIKLLIIDCLQRHSHSTHLTVNKAFDYIKKIAPERAGLIHMGHDLSHSELSKMCESVFGKTVFPLFDQLKLFY